MDVLLLSANLLAHLICDIRNGTVFNPMNHQEFVDTLRNACKKYAGQNKSERKNLMPCSFSDYVIAFKNINS